MRCTKHHNFMRHVRYMRVVTAILLCMFASLSGAEKSLVGKNLLGKNPVKKNIVNVYSARATDLMRPILNQFEQETGISVNLITGKADALLKRIEREGQATPADLFITVDAGRLFRAKEAKVLQPIHSHKLKQSVPAEFRDEDDEWFGLSKRIRTVIYAKDRLSPDQLTSYEALTDPQWHKHLCVRSSDNIYNQSLVASMIAAKGEAYAGKWIKGLVNNFARKPQGNDRAQIQAVAAGLCDIAIVNTYYYGIMLNSRNKSQKKAAEKVSIAWLNQEDRGAHVNISGAGVTKYAKNKANAIALLEFMATEKIQRTYAEVNYEYPVVKGVGLSKLVASWGKFKADEMHLKDLGPNNTKAVKLMDRYGWR